MKTHRIKSWGNREVIGVLRVRTRNHMSILCYTLTPPPRLQGVQKGCQCLSVADRPPAPGRRWGSSKISNTEQTNTYWAPRAMKTKKNPRRDPECETCTKCQKKLNKFQISKNWISLKFTYTSGMTVVVSGFWGCDELSLSRGKKLDLLVSNCHFLRSSEIVVVVQTTPRPHAFWVSDLCSTLNDEPFPKKKPWLK